MRAAPTFNQIRLRRGVRIIISVYGRKFQRLPPLIETLETLDRDAMIFLIIILTQTQSEVRQWPTNPQRSCRVFTIFRIINSKIREIFSLKATDVSFVIDTKFVKFEWHKCIIHRDATISCDEIQARCLRVHVARDRNRFLKKKEKNYNNFRASRRFIRVTKGKEYRNRRSKLENFGSYRKTRMCMDLRWAKPLHRQWASTRSPSLITPYDDASDGGDSVEII